jgi:hypothetical protein
MLHFTYQKSTTEVATKVEAKSKALMEKLAERRARVQKIRSDYGIDDKAWIEVLEQKRHDSSHQLASYSFTNSGPAGPTGPTGSQGEQVQKSSIAAGLVQNLLTEGDAIKAEEAAVKRLDMISRNLRPISRMNERTFDHWTDPLVLLSENDLEFLGF